MIESLPDSLESVLTDRSNEQLTSDLADSELLNLLTIGLIEEKGLKGLYKKIASAGIEITQSQFGTVQLLFPENSLGGKWQLLADAGFAPDNESFRERVNEQATTLCNRVLESGYQTVIPDYGIPMHGSPTVAVPASSELFVVQGTPMHSRNGKLLGIITTHWNSIHYPSKNRLKLLTVFARQASELIDRVNASDQLLRSEDRLRALTTATSNVVYRMSPDWSEMYQLYGQNFLKNVGDPVKNWIEQFIHPEDQQLVEQHILKACQSETEFELEHRVFKSDGSIGWVFSRAVPIKDSEGRLTEWFGAATDITDKKAFVLDLERKVKERTTELQRSNSDLQQFAQVASHDLKEPVRKITTFGALLQRELMADGTDQEKVFIEKILRSIGRMGTMIDGILAYSLSTAPVKNIELLDLNQLITEIQNDLELLIAEKQAKIDCEPLPKLEGVKVLIYQLFYNLINNALKFSKTTELPVIKISSKELFTADADSVVITVMDNGIGFEPEYNESIFKTFTRLNPKTYYEGTGLGLSLAKKIVERHRGSIAAIGNPDAGAVFILTLPLHQPAG